jgi:hypothetical protein
MNLIRKSLLTAIFSLTLLTQSFAWGAMGHYIIGKMAEWQMKPKTVKKVEAVLNNESISGVGVWMDNIRSDKNYDYTNTWHWVTTVDGTYDKALQEEAGDAYEAFLRIKEALKKGGLDPKTERDQLRMLIHILGDLHQPFHVGKPGDRGGNDVKVKFFNRDTNIHAVWDTDMVENKKMGFSDYAAELQKRLTKESIKNYKNSSPSDWLVEAVKLRPAMYDIPEDGKMGYEYLYKYTHLVEERLTAAGVRLAQVLEEIYGK